MISAKELRNVQVSKFTQEELTYIIQQAADTIDAYVGENKEVYEKLNILAQKVEQYREEEDSIKAALITAEKSAEQTRRQAKETADSLVAESTEKANATIADANANAEKIVAEAREYSSNLLQEKTLEAQNIVLDAEKKANEAINSSKIVAQNILDQAKEISTDLVTKSKEEKEAYQLLIDTIKADAKDFVQKLKDLYTEELEALESANFEASTGDTQQQIDDIHQEFDSLVGEIDEMQNAIPSSIYLEDLEAAQAELDANQDDQQIEQSAQAEEVPQPEEIEDFAQYEQTPQADDVIQYEPITQLEAELEFDVVDDSDFEQVEEIGEIEEVKETQDEPQAAFELDFDDDDEPADPMAAVAAFSSNEYVPYEKTSHYISEIDEEPEMEASAEQNSEKSLFDEDALPFESFFTIKREAPQSDRSETISLVPPEEDDDEPKFRGFFKRKK